MTIVTPEPTATKTVNTIHSLVVNPDDVTPMFRQFIEVKHQYPGVLLLYRMGDFYETFFEDALIAAKALELTLTARDCGKLGKIPMAGFPEKTQETYLARLVEQGFQVAICEQVEDPALAKGLVKREVVRVLSPGTITEFSQLRPDANNFLAALVLPSKSNAKYGLAWCDITTGGFYAAELVESQVMAELERIAPTELLVKGRKQRIVAGVAMDEWVPDVPQSFVRTFKYTPLPDSAFDAASTAPQLCQWFGVQSLEGYGLHEAKQAQVACGAIGYYLRQQFVGTPPQFQGISLIRLDNAMALTASARRNLELLTTVRDGKSDGTLFWVLNQTATPMGARLLRQWVSQPLVYLPEIQSRLDAVEALVSLPGLAEALRNVLPGIYDLERLGTRLLNSTAAPRDLVGLKHALQQLPKLSAVLSSFDSPASPLPFYLARLSQAPSALLTMANTIQSALADTPAITLKEGGVIRDGFDADLDAMRQLVAHQNEWLANYEAAERERSGIKTLKVAFNNAFGFYIEISRAQAQNATTEQLASYHRKQTLTNAERFTTPELKAFEDKVLDAQARQFEREAELYVQLRQSLQPTATQVLQTARDVAALDVLTSLAQVAIEQGYTRPVVDESLVLNLVDCRHPVVEKRLPMGQFVANSCALSSEPELGDVPQIQIITGPNMAGKSTYMRQVALCVVMAQIGSFVPAKHAHIGLVDALYTRVGAVDDLAAGQSTFMVEMQETAQILNNATRRSLVVLDEVGRGTSTYDGVSIAWSVTEDLATRLGCRTLFATHYHELNVLEKAFAQVKNVRVCVSEGDTGEIVFLHTVEAGAAQKSYGIQVARMAGVPKSVTDRANGLLNQLNKKELATIQARHVREALQAEVPQLSLF
jgi:DNA mismatch repair protein MutS